MSEFTGLHDKVCIFSSLVFNSHEYSVAYENLHPSTDAYKQVAYKKWVYPFPWNSFDSLNFGDLLGQAALKLLKV